MKTILPLLLFLTGCATITADSDQPITVATEPAGASCNLRNALGEWAIDETPGSVRVKRSFSSLKVTCGKDGVGARQTIEAKTRGRAYGNILLLGVPALVDAGTGDG